MPEEGQGLKPGWRGLKSVGDFKTPVIEFVGKLSKWRTEPSQFGNTIRMQFTNCQVLRADAPYTAAEVSLNIKFSEYENSGWGKLGASFAKVLNTSIDLLDVDFLVGQFLHMLRYDNVDFGFVTKEGDQARGTVWACEAIVLPGASVAPKSIAPVLPIASPSISITVPSGVPVASPLLHANNIEEKVLYLMHGKTLAEWYQTVLTDTDVRAKPDIQNSILGGTFLAAKKASGEVKEDTSTGRFVVAALVS